MSGQNHVVRVLQEIEVSADHVTEVLQCLLHTIVFGRWPDEVQPQEVQLVHFPVAYACVSDPNVRTRIAAAIDTFMDNLVPAGPDLHKGFVTLTFFKQRTNKVVFWQYQEKVVWEEWIVPVLVDSTPQPAGDPRISAEERHRLQNRSDAGFTESLRQRMQEIFLRLNDTLDHVPGSSEASHHFEVSCAQRSETSSSVVRPRNPLPVGV